MGNRIFTALILFCIITFFDDALHAQFNVNTNVTALQMAQELTGPGVVVTNASFNGAPQHSRGIYTATGTTLPLEFGIVLTTGRAITSGVNWGINRQASSNASTNNGTPGDPSLNNLLNGGNSLDACVLEFDFQPTGSLIEFKFVFGSEEYPEYNCTQFNDVFGFFISGPGITGEKNLALVPGTDIPVTINSINNGVPGGSGNIDNCTNLGDGSPFTQYYINNSGSSTIVYDGLTTILIAQQEVIPCETYHMKLAIADVSDRIFDSGVFLESSSFTSEVAELEIISDPVFPVCPTNSAVFTAIATNVGDNPMYTWFKNDIVVGNGAVYNANDLQEGDLIYCMINYFANCSGEQVRSNVITVTFLPNPEATENASICEGESYIFNGIEYFEANNTAMDTIPGENGCDTIVTLNLTLAPGIVPVFSQIGPLCQHSTPPDLPLSSNNSPPISGTWTPSTINTSLPGSFVYTFHPDPDQCGLPTIMTIVIDPEITPTFDMIGPFCLNDSPPPLPSVSTNNPPIAGTWNPSTINTTTVGVTSYTFTPNADVCAEEISIDIEITDPVEALFDPIGPLCQNQTAPGLPGTSNNNPPISGQWSPAVINTSTPGTTTYTFTPNAGECGLPTTMDIEILPEIDPEFDQLGPYCKGDTPDNLPLSSNNDPAIPGTWSPAVINTSVSGTFTFTFTPDASVCATIFTMEIVINEPDIPQFDDFGPYCLNDPQVTLPGMSNDNPPFTGSWMPPEINTSVAGTHTYTFTPDAGQCADVAVLEVEITNPIVPAFTAIDPLCVGDSEISLPGNSNDAPPITGSWVPPIVSTSSSGTTTYVFTPDADQCASPTSLDVQVNDPIDPVFNPIGPLCQYSTPPALPASSSDSPPISGTWSPSVINTSTPGIFDYTFTPANGECANPFVLSIEILPEIQPILNIQQEYCVGDVGEVLPQESENNPPIPGTWNPAVVNTSTAGTFNYTFTPAAGHCAPPVIIPITIVRPITPFFNPIGPLCVNAIAPNLPLQSDDATPYTGSWNPSIINTSVVGTFNYTFTPDPGQCATSYVMQITIFAPPPPTFNTFGPYCLNETPPELPVFSNDNPAISGTWNPASINTNVAGTFNYTFTPDDGQCAIATTIAITIDNPVIPTFNAMGPYCLGGVPGSLPIASTNNPPISGTWDPPVINTDIAGPSVYTFTPIAGQCATTATLSITINDLPQINIDPVSELCLDDEAITLTAQPAGGSWSGNFVDGDQFNPAGVGNFTIFYTYTDGLGCTNLTSTTITVNDCSCLDPASVDAGSNGTICVGGTYSLSGEVWVAGSAVWSTNGTGTFGNINDLQTTYTPGPEDIVAGSVVITLTSSDPDGEGPCSPVSDQMTLTIQNTVVSITPVSPLCYNNGIVPLQAIPSGGIWSGNPGVVNDYFDPILAGPGVHTVIYALTGSCIGSDTISITVYPQVTLDITAPDVLCLGDPAVTLSAIPVGGVFIGPGVMGQIFTPNVEGTFDITYVYTDANQCVHVENFTIVVLNCDCTNQPTVNAGADQNVCPGSDVILSGNVTGTTAQWSSSGNGTFGNSSQVATTYTPSASDINAGSVVLTLTGLDPDGEGPCNEVTDQMVITFTKVIVTLDLVDPMCIDHDAITLTASPAGGSFSGAGMTGNIFNPAIAGAGIHSITYTTSGACPGTASISIIVYALPAVGIVDPGELCVGDEALIIEGVPAGGDFTIDGISTSTLDPVSPGVFTIQYTYIDDNGCSASTTLDVEVNDCGCDNPVTANAGPNFTVCMGDEIILDMVVSTHTTGVWSTTGNGFFDDPTANPARYQPGDNDIANGKVLFTLTALDPDGDGPCSPSTDQLEVTIIQVVPVINPVGPMCVDASMVVLQAVPANGVFSGPGVSGNVFDPAVAGPGTHTILYTVTDPCTGQAEITITVFALPDVSIEPIATLCAGEDLYMLVGHPSGGSFSGTNVVNNQFDPLSPGIYAIVYHYKDLNGCEASAETDIVVSDCDCPDQVTANAGADISVCYGQPINLSGTVSSNTIGIWSSVGDGAFSNEYDMNATYTPGENDISTGKVSITLTAQDPDGDGPCSPFSDVMMVTIITIPEPDFSGIPVDYCLDASPVVLQATPAGGTWIGEGITGQVFDPALSGTGIFTLYYTVKQGNCTVLDSLVVNVEDCSCLFDINVDAGPDITVCKDEPVVMAAVVSGTTDFSWSSSGSGTFIGAGSLTAQYIPSAQDINIGNVTLVLTTADPDGNGPCVAMSDQLTVRFLQIDVVNLLVEQPDCNTGTGTLNVLPPTTLNFLYSIDDGEHFVTENVITGLAPGQYTLIVKDGITGCQTSTDFTIINPPVVDADWKALSTACSDLNANRLTIESAQNVTYPLTVLLNDVSYSPIQQLPWRLDDVPFGEHELVIVDALGCEINGSFVLSETVKIGVSLDAVIVIDKGESVVLQPIITGEYTRITWTPDRWLSCSNCVNPIATPLEEIIYRVKVTDSQGCVDEESIRIVIRKRVDIFAPNAITPNNDGVNDRFTLFTDEQITNIGVLRIFSRWGEQVFEKYNFPPNLESEGWDGKFNNRSMNPAVFVWYAEVEIPGDGIQIIKGDFTIIE